MYNEASKVGSVIDILGDRIVENAYWIVFACYGWVGIWVPLIVMTRSFLCDTLRGLAYADGCTAFGDDSMVQSKLGRFLTSSRFSRAVYGGAKLFAFMFVIACHIPSWQPPQWLILLTDVSVYLAVIFCVLRAIPVVVAGAKYFTVKKD
jgi:CDP-diacylglycerol--glycerol-3-phosphate 3-phosphatidyltransferase